jgi:hypothetical protein
MKESQQELSDAIALAAAIICQKTADATVDAQPTDMPFTCRNNCLCSTAYYNMRFSYNLSSNACLPAEVI